MNKNKENNEENMKPVKSFIVTAHLPENLSKLKELAYNYWWCWNSDAKELFIRTNRSLWEEVNHNPVLLINKLSQEQLKELSEQADYTSFIDYIYEKFQKYIKAKTWYQTQNNSSKGVIAYFSTEYGINESFPNYSGGLGILSGDHLKSSSDLGLPLVGVGLLYQQGYFRQHLTQHGWQTEIYSDNDFFSMPLILQRDSSGNPILGEVDLPLGRCYFQIWMLKIGRVPLYLIDTNIDQNSNQDYKDITNALYGGDRETRIQQEIVLGIGGMRALKQLGIVPEVVHINEGHAAFALLERARMYKEKFNIDFRSAKQIVKTSSIFTTHTPVPAGNETFKVDKIDTYFSKYINELGITRENFIELGQTNGFNSNEDFSMTIVGLKLTSYHNGVSKLHGNVARKMWKSIWKCFPDDEVPIKSVTNGIHTMTWVAREFSELFDRYLTPRWRTDSDNQELWEKIETIPAEEIWREKQRRRIRLVLFARQYLQSKQKQFLVPEQISQINNYLDPEALTIGFARRFATYKRAMLLFKDMDRLYKILTNPERPVQIILAGKAHPHDTQGKEAIQSIIHKIRTYHLEKHIVFLEDYDMVIARFMVKGCDVWLNTPIRPMEASGTSGMKAALNGTLNFSILDGWWDEAYNGSNGFCIGRGEEYTNYEEQEIIESGALYDVLEQQIIPMFYYRKQGNRLPDKWVAFMKNSISTIAGNFSSQRMVKDYSNVFYIPALKNYQNLISNNGAKAVKLKEWKDTIRNQWDTVDIISVEMKENGEYYVGKPISVQAIVSLGNLTTDDVDVQVYYGTVNSNNEIEKPNFVSLNLSKSQGNIHYYEGTYICSDTGKQGFTIRVLPKHPLIVDSTDLYRCCWA